MKKHDKEILQNSLNNEAAVLKRLEKVYRKALNDVVKKSKELQDRINGLTDAFEAATDETEKAVIQSMIQSKVYQKQYQDALKKQISSILDNMQVESFKTIDEYLQKCYEDGFIGVMYSLRNQGIPLIMPINQESMINAVQLDSKISEGLYNHLCENVKDLKKSITAEVSRGISNGSSFAQVAQQLSFKMVGTYDNPGGALAYALRIARTEGHRIQTTAAMNACYDAKNKGCDIVKQWDATLDNRTRKRHRRVDGEIRELDERFSNGLLYPGDPAGGASEVIHCRCALLQRAKWALDEAELETLKERAEYFELDKTANFDEYKRKYLKAVAEHQEATKEIKDAIDFAYGDYTQDDFNEWMNHYDKINSDVHVTDSELKIIEDYTEGSYIAYNAVSRGTEDRLLKMGYKEADFVNIRKNADVLEDVLSRYKLDTNIVTHRFERDVSWLTGKGNDIEDLKNMIGEEYTAKGFTSSGMLPNRFRFTGGKKDAVHFEIITPEGTNGAFLSMSKKGENEFLYNRNTRFVVLDGGERTVKETKFNIRTNKLEEIDVVEHFLKVQVVLH